jgi:hypothetical protein
LRTSRRRLTSAAVDGFDVVNEQQAVYQRLGYCPQSSPLLEQLTGRETLTFYAQLRGLEPAALPAHCEELLRQRLRPTALLRARCFQLLGAARCAALERRAALSQRAHLCARVRERALQRVALLARTVELRLEIVDARRVA